MEGQTLILGVISQGFHCICIFWEGGMHFWEGGASINFSTVILKLCLHEAVSKSLQQNDIIIN